MSRPRIHRLSGGPRAGSARRAEVGKPWWTHVHPGISSSPVVQVTGGWAPDGQAEEEQGARRMAQLASLAREAEGDGVEDVLAAVGAGVRTMGLNGCVAVLEPGGRALVVTTLALGCAPAAEVARVLGRAVVGSRIDLAEAEPYRRAVEGRSALRVEAPIWWARLAVARLGSEEAEALAELIQLRDVVLAPIAADRTVFDVLTVWATTLSETDLATAAVVGRIAGAAVASAATAGIPRECTVND